MTATKTKPVTQKVTSTVWSIVVQFDAIGVNHHGSPNRPYSEAKWNATVATTSRISAQANTIRSPPVALVELSFYPVSISSAGPQLRPRSYAFFSAPALPAPSLSRETLLNGLMKWESTPTSSASG